MNRFTRVFSSSALISAAVLWSAAAQAHIHTDHMQMDGDTSEATSLPPFEGDAPYDWDLVCQRAGICPGGGTDDAVLSRFVIDSGVTGTGTGDDQQTGPDRSYWAGGNKDIMPLSDMGCVVKRNPQTKSNLMNFFANFYTDPHLVGFGGATLEEQAGTDTFGFWMLQDPTVGCDPAVNGGQWQGQKLGGDVFLLADLTPSGGPLLKVFFWTDPDGIPENGDECLGDGVDCSPLHADQPFAAGFQCTNPAATDYNNDNICAEVNTVSVSSDWGTISPLSLFEATVDFSERFPGVNFNAFLAESRASDSLTAQVKDYILMKVNTNPRLEIRKVANDAGTFGFGLQDPQAQVTAFNLTTGSNTAFDSIDPGAYTLTETGLPAATPPQAWVIADIQCVSSLDPNNPISGNTATGEVNLNLGPAEEMICTYINFLEDPSIDIEKATNGVDADTTPGPSITVGETVNWTYVVTNTGNVPLDNVVVTDNPVQAISCPQSILAVGESMTCTASDTAAGGQYSNTATASGDSPSDETVQDTDDSHYLGTALPAPALSIKKSTNGQDADTAPGPSVLVGSTVNWSYVVTNIGNIELTNITVSDDQEVIITCPGGGSTIVSLAVSASQTCTASGAAVEGQYTNVGTASTDGAEDSDASNYLGLLPAIELQKLTNGEDVDATPGALVQVGDPVVWDYIVTNTGDVTLNQVGVTDSPAQVITCPATSLIPGESMDCTAEGVALAGQYSNTATAVGTPVGGSEISAEDNSYYFGVNAAITVEKSTNGEDADVGPGPVIPAGDPVTWTYLVTNTGSQPLVDILLEDNREGLVTCPEVALGAGEFMTCTASGTAKSGLYRNIATVGGTPTPLGDNVTGTDASHYTGEGDGPVDIPTLMQWALILLSMMLAMGAMFRLRAR